jgi:SAM-dependent methyltransferase
MLPLTKVMHLPDDVERFGRWTRNLLDQTPNLLDGQHPARFWEYGMALQAIAQWQLAHTLSRAQEIPGQEWLPPPVVSPLLQILDAGGASSNFWVALSAVGAVTRVDPLPAQGGLTYSMDLAAYAQERHLPFDVVTAISVIEHIPDVQERPGAQTPLTQFLAAAHTLLRPGGLFVLTTDYWDAEGPDVAHFHWMRERIYNPVSFQGLIDRVRKLGFRLFGESDPTWYGPQVYEYAMASLVLVKEEVPQHGT